MAFKLLVLLSVVVASLGQKSTSHVSASSGRYSHSRYSPQPPSYHGHPHPPATDPKDYPFFSPACGEKTTKDWCLEDDEYPTEEIKQAVESHLPKVLSLYADVADLNTQLSVERPRTLKEETYLCPSETSYVKPLRIRDVDGNYQIIVNNIEVHYQKLTQTTRLEECLTSGEACPKVSDCYETKCLQKSVYHRFLVYNPYDKYFPFVIKSFKLPSSCACFLGESTTRGH